MGQKPQRIGITASRSLYLYHPKLTCVQLSAPSFFVASPAPSGARQKKKRQGWLQSQLLCKTRPGPGSTLRLLSRPRTFPSPVPKQTGHVNDPKPSHSGQTTPLYRCLGSLPAKARQNPVPEQRSHGTLPDPTQFLHTFSFFGASSSAAAEVVCGCEPVTKSDAAENSVRRRNERREMCGGWLFGGWLRQHVHGGDV